MSPAGSLGVVMNVPHKDPEARKAYRRRYYLFKRQEFVDYARQQRADRGEAINVRRRELRAEKPLEWFAAYLEYQRKWHAARPGYAREAGRLYRDRHPEHKVYQQQWREGHREEINAYFAQRQRKAGRGMSDQDKRESTEWRKIIAGDPCFYCRTTTAGAYEDDHYVSVAHGGTDHWWNLVRACVSCNRRKASMNGDEFLTPSA